MRMAPPAPQPTHAPSSTVQTANTVDRCRAMWNTIRRSRPDSGPGCSIFKVRVKYSFHVVPFLLGSGPARILDTRGARSHNCDRSSPPPKQKSCSMYYGERAVERRERGQRERERTGSTRRVPSAADQCEFCTRVLSLQRHPEAGSSWPGLPRVTHPINRRRWGDMAYSGRCESTRVLTHRP